ncbi:hypothetical protein C499_10044 [Halogeometricum borinquense DSM 11551]|uniref:Uncharacterized protein n=1 Tax=Halogeometricum borinquense (strain ATCC 700274 / DSM 11551 / JCM 10706 / KCTC 4070 / PR3) TaxID=469382 RepID=L9URQ8_HALBP|nr:DUF6517 family protein [Halogeometricum borinquense]ELY27396.1 hypothetical protein C499_10044 [Halogeometricum borinquense DSM 11551]
MDGDPESTSDRVERTTTDTKRHGRRAFLGLAAVTGVSALAGCSGTGGTVSAARRPPTVPEEQLKSGGWEQVDDVTQDPAFEQDLGPVTMTAATRTRLYEDTELRAEIADKTLGQAATQFATFFATRVTFDPDLTSLPAGAGQKELLDQVESQSRTQFRNRLKEAGLKPVEQVGTGTFDVASGTSARLTEYEASYSFEGFSVNVGTEDITIEGGEISVAGHLAAWIADNSVLVAGGAYPAENFARSVTKNPSDAIELSVDIDLGLTPKAYRKELFGLMRQVE